MSGAYLTAARLRDLDAQLGDRDKAILRRVSGLRFVTGAQLTRLHFAGVPARTTRQALLRLTRLDVLERLPRPVGGVRAGSAGYVYRVGPAGERLAGSHDWLPDGRKWQPRVPGTLFVAHALGVAELHTRLVEADRDGEVELLELAGETASRRDYGGPFGPRILKPDSFVRLGVGDYEDSYFIEVDLGTEGSRALLGKLRQYVEYAAAGQEQAAHGVFPKVLWLTPDESRARVIRGCVRQLSVDSRELFAVAPFDHAMGVLSGDIDAADLPNPSTDVTKEVVSQSEEGGINGIRTNH
jgi:Replication-relaxation